MTKLIIAGSRGVTDYGTVRESVIASGFWKAYGKTLEIVSGTARGVDRLGEEFANKNGLLIHRFPADWDKLGKAAGHIRNCEMGKFADCLLAVWDGKSKGTEQMINYMKSLQKEYFVFHTDGQPHEDGKIYD